MTVVRRYASQLAGVLLLLGGYGLVASLVSMDLAARGYTAWVGWVGGSYFLGLGLGSSLGGVILARLGYLRAYGVLTATACAATLLLTVFGSPAGWLGARLVMGFALGGVFVCVESWLASTAEIGSRGRVLGVYQVVVYVGLVFGQVLLGALAHDVDRALLVAAALVGLAAIPVGAARPSAPIQAGQAALGPRELWGCASVAVVGAAVSGLTTGAIYTVAPAMGVVAGLDPRGVAWLMGAFVSGGMALQIPLGRASDRYDRRLVLGVVGGFAVLGAAMSALALGSPVALVALAAFEGGWVFAIYALALAHAYDRVPPDRATAANATMLVVFCAGSAAGSGASAMSLDALGPAGFYLVLGAPAAALAAVAAWGAGSASAAARYVG